MSWHAPQNSQSARSVMLVIGTASGRGVLGSNACNPVCRYTCECSTVDPPPVRPFRYHVEIVVLSVRFSVCLTPVLDWGKALQASKIVADLAASFSFSHLTTELEQDGLVAAEVVRVLAPADWGTAGVSGGGQSCGKRVL